MAKKSKSKGSTRRRNDSRELLENLFDSFAHALLRSEALVEVPQESDADFDSFTEHLLAPILEELEVRASAGVDHPRIVVYQLKQSPAAPTWCQVDVLSGNPALILGGAEALCTLMDHALAKSAGTVVAWHISVRPNDIPGNFHVIYLRHTSGGDAQFVVNGDAILPIPRSSDFGRNLAFGCLDTKAVEASRLSFLEPFHKLAKNLSDDPQAIRRDLVAQGFNSPEISDQDLSDVVRWVLSDNHIRDTLIPLLWRWSRDQLEAPVTNLSQIAVKAAHKAYEIVAAGRKEAEDSANDIFQRKYRKVFDELETTRKLMTGAREGAARAQAEIQSLRNQLATGVTVPDVLVPPVPKLGDALNAFFV